MDQQSNAVEVLRRAELKFGFRFACELHSALQAGTPEARLMLRQVMAA